MQELGTDLIRICANIADAASADSDLRAEQLRLMAERCRVAWLAHRPRSAGLGGTVKRFSQRPIRELSLAYSPGAATYRSATRTLTARWTTAADPHNAS
jgi:hypothetical protein